MDTVLKYPWQQAVLNALLELRPEDLPKKINLAQQTILERLHSSLPDTDERASLNDGLSILWVVFSSSCGVRDVSTPK
jgi:hypothetical protein